MGDQSQCEIWITTEYTKGSGSCSRESRITVSWRTEREKLSLQKWFSSWNIRQIWWWSEDLQEYSALTELSFTLLFSSQSQEGCMVSMKRWHTFPVWNDQAWKSSACSEIPFLMQGVFVFAPSHFPHFWNIFLYHCWRKTIEGSRNEKKCLRVQKRRVIFDISCFGFAGIHER